VVILDEATSRIDREMDRILKDVMRQKGTDCAIVMLHIDRTQFCMLTRLRLWIGEVGGGKGHGI
jgi:hypothetical protein